MDRSQPRRVAPSLTVLALIFGASVPMARLFRSGGLAMVVILAAGGCVGVAALTRRLNAGAIVSWLAQGLALFLFVSYRFAPHSLVGPLPTARTLGALGDRLEAGARIINSETAPILAHDEVLLYLALGIWVTAWLIDLSLTVVGNPLLAIASAVPLYAMPGTLVPSENRVIELIAFALPAAIVLLAHEQRRRRLWRIRPASMMLVGALMAALILTPILPGFGAAPLLPGKGDRRQVFNPFVAIKPALDRSRESLLFTVTTTRPGYHRLTALDRFDGKVWSQSTDQSRTALDSQELPPSKHAGDVVEVRESTQIANLGGVWIPLAYDPIEVSVRSLFSELLETEVEDEPRSVILETTVSRGMKVESRSLVPAPDARELDQVRGNAGLRRYLTLPRSTPRDIKRISTDVAGDEETPFRKAVALQAHLRTFTYDEDVAAGHSFSTLSEFLTTVKRGYCEQFAGAMAVMARSLDLPSRVVIGFTAGNLIARRGRQLTYEVTSRHAHAWVEIYFQGHGWIAFEPTPRSGFATPPGYTSPDLDDLPEPDTSPTASASASSEPSTVPSARPSQDAAGGGGGRDFPVGPVSAVIAIALFIAAAAASMPHLRRRRRGALATFPGYGDLLAWCEAAGLGRRDSETPREHLARVASVTGVPVHELADPLDLVLWAGSPQQGLDARLAGARKAMSAGLGWRHRVAAGIRWHIGWTG